MPAHPRQLELATSPLLPAGSPPHPEAAACSSLDPVTIHLLQSLNLPTDGHGAAIGLLTQANSLTPSQLLLLARAALQHLDPQSDPEVAHDVAVMVSAVIDDYPRVPHYRVRLDLQSIQYDCHIIRSASLRRLAGCL